MDSSKILSWTALDLQLQSLKQLYAYILKQRQRRKIVWKWCFKVALPRNTFEPNFSDQQIIFLFRDNSLFIISKEFQFSTTYLGIRQIKTWKLYSCDLCNFDAWLIFFYKISMTVILILISLANQILYKNFYSLIL